MNTPEKQLSESLLAACKAAGIEKPKYIAQDKDEPYVWHYDLKPDTDDTKELDMWAVDNGNATKIHHPPYAEDWKESLLEWVEHIADTSKMIDDACKIAYQNHLRKGDGLCWSRAGDYRAGWEDALAWKGGASE
jgi:hypothetical protein